VAQTAGGQPLLLHSSGDGPWQLLLAADDGEIGRFLLALAPPDHATFRTLPDLNPDGLPDFWTSADTGYDGCRINDGVGKPFQSAESRALRDQAAGATLALLFQRGSTNRIWLDSCQQQPAARQAAEQLAAATGWPVPALRNLSGHFSDWLAGEGVPTLLIELDGPPPAALQEAILRLADRLPALAEAEMAATGATTFWLHQSADTTWHWSTDSLIHPLALAQDGERLFVLDSGRVLALTPTDGPTVLLQPGDRVDGVPVLEPLDMAAGPDGLLMVLDRAGDIYRLADGVWVLERYDRPIGLRSAHYYTALAVPDQRRLLLETSAPLVLRYNFAPNGALEEGTLLLPDEGHPVDLALLDDQIYLLSQQRLGAEGAITLFVSGEERLWTSPVPIRQPRQLAVTAATLWLLDYDGDRLLAFDRQTRRLLQVWRFADRQRITAFHVSADDQQLILAGRDRLTFVGGEWGEREVESADLRLADLPHATERLAALPPLHIPVGIPLYTQRDYQMPGAPRHYRLGIHEGIDFYWQRGTPVSAIADGVVVRADHAWREPSVAQFNAWLAQSAELGATSPEATDFFRGRQLWIDHGDGLVSRMVHLSAIYPDIVVGAMVRQGQPLGEVGNSGSPGALVDEYEDTHLHLELRIGEGYVGQYFRPIEIREWMRRLLR
jgi:hypothetical protein